MYDVNTIRSQFKSLRQMVNGYPLVYLDSVNTTLKPDRVVARIEKFYAEEASNVHRGSHFLSDQATKHFENARQTIQKFIGAANTEEVIFTKGTTEGINLVAQSYGMNFINEGDEIVITELEHHANLVPWQNVALQRKAVLKFIAVNADGSIDEASIDTTITAKTKLVAFSGCSNILGTITPYKKIIAKAKSVGAVTLLDAAQLVTQKAVNVVDLDVDFLVFSAHKLFGPYGFGILYGKKELLLKMPPYQFGGSMISEVRFEKTTYNDLPFKFEAGTPHIEGALALAEAINFFTQYDIKEVFAHEQELLNLAVSKLKEIPEIQFFGEAKDKAAILSFNLKGIHHADVGQILDKMGIAVRIGHHCTQPLLRKFGLTGTVRASFSIYNNKEDVERLVLAVEKAKRMLL